jgi:ABC-2 type transport system ATP-binding protein
MDYAIQTQALSKHYRVGKLAKTALDRLDLTVQRGEIFGYLGPNGAGKTTTIRLMLDLIRPTAGAATLLGLDAHKQAVQLHRRIGYLPGELNLWDSLKGRDVIRYVGQLRGGVDQGYVKRLCEQLSLDLSKAIRTYSTGNKRKIGLVIALMHKPELLILDEPTNGLDPLMQQTFHSLMREVQAEGRTVFLSSHILSEVQAICERVAILRDGQLKAVERVETLTQVKFTDVTLTFARPVSANRLNGIAGVSAVTTDANHLSFRLAGDFQPVLGALNGEYIHHIRTEDPSLEDIFLSFYSNSTPHEATQGVMEGQTA